VVALSPGTQILSIYLWLYSPCGPWPLFQFLNPYIVGRTPWTGDHPVTRQLHTEQRKHRINAHTDIRASSGIRIHDSSVRAVKTVHALDRAAAVIGKASPSTSN
jgi:hypothetical protein